MFNRPTRQVRKAREAPGLTAAMPLPLALRESVLAGFASLVPHVPPRPAALDALLCGEADDRAVGEVAGSVFVAEGRDREAQQLYESALMTRRKALALAELLPAPADTVGVSALLHRAGEACALRALARAESATRVRLDAPSRAELCALHQALFTEHLVSDWGLPAPIADVLRTWRQFRPTVSLAAAIVHYAHLLASEALHPEFFAPGLLQSVGAELGIDPARLGPARSGKPGGPIARHPGP